MPHIDLPQDLFQQIDQLRTGSLSTTEFVAQAVREKLETQRRTEKLRRLADDNRRAMLEKGLSEEDILADFEAWRKRGDDRRG
mgnify:CR=1 FL=1